MALPIETCCELRAEPRWLLAGRRWRLPLRWLLARRRWARGAARGGGGGGGLLAQSCWHSQPSIDSWTASAAQSSAAQSSAVRSRSMKILAGKLGWGTNEPLLKAGVGLIDWVWTVDGGRLTVWCCCRPCQHRSHRHPACCCCVHHTVWWRGWRRTTPLAPAAT
jgi:hypothetical protein